MDNDGITPVGCSIVGVFVTVQAVRIGFGYKLNVLVHAKDSICTVKIPHHIKQMYCNNVVTAGTATEVIVTSTATCITFTRNNKPVWHELETAQPPYVLITVFYTVALTHSNYIEIYTTGSCDRNKVCFSFMFTSLTKIVDVHSTFAHKQTNDTTLCVTRLMTAERYHTIRIHFERVICTANTAPLLVYTPLGVINIVVKYTPLKVFWRVVAHGEKVYKAVYINFAHTRHGKRGASTSVTPLWWIYHHIMVSCYKIREVKLNVPHAVMPDTGFDGWPVDCLTFLSC